MTLEAYQKQMAELGVERGAFAGRFKGDRRIGGARGGGGLRGWL